jgi:HEAT repeat protein
VAAVEALVRIERDAVPALAAALPTAEEVSRKCILHALEQIGPPAAAAVPEIIAVLQETRGAVPEHLATVQERHPGTRGDWAGCGTAIPHLSILLEDSHRVIRTLAVFALIAIEPTKAASLLVEAFKVPKAQKDIVTGVVWSRLAGRQQQARRILEGIGLPAAVPSLIAILEGDHEAGPKVRLTEEAVNVLNWIGPDAAAAVPALLALRKKPFEIEGLDSALQNIQPLRHDDRHSRRRNSRSQG